MPNPKRRHSKTRGRNRRSHNALVAPQLAACGHCKETIPPHTICPTCGYYGKRAIIKHDED